MVLLKNSTTQITVTLAVLLTLLWIFGFTWTIQDIYYGSAAESSPKEEPKNSQTTEQTTKKIVVALGDSLTRGTGDDSGKGYVGFVTEHLKEQLEQQEMMVHNLGINGQTSTQLIQQLKQPNVTTHIKEADVILMTIGGNDLFQKGETLQNLSLENIKKIQKEYLENLKQIFTQIREQNDLVTVFILGLYNPFIDLDESKITNTIVRNWNFATENMTGEFDQIVFVPTFDLFQLSVNDYLYSDHFHPNQAGYQLISDRLAPLINWEKAGESND